MITSVFSVTKYRLVLLNIDMKNHVDMVAMVNHVMCFHSDKPAGLVPRFVHKNTFGTYVNS